MLINVSFIINFELLPCGRDPSYSSECRKYHVKAVASFSWHFNVHCQKRPKDSSLNVGKAGRVLNNKPEQFETAIEKLKNEMNSKTT